MTNLNLTNNINYETVTKYIPYGDLCEGVVEVEAEGRRVDLETRVRDKNRPKKS